jgi:hypothetical protein
MGQGKTPYPWTLPGYCAVLFLGLQCYGDFPQQEGGMPESIMLEDSEGNRIVDPSEDQIASVIEKIGGKLDHCILHLGSGKFLQTAGSRNQLLLQYDDGSGLFESSRTDFDAQTVSRIFVSALNGQVDWKTTYDFSRASAGGGDEPSGRAESADTSSSRSGGRRSLKDQLIDSVKRETESGINQIVRQGVRGIFRKKF